MPNFQPALSTASARARVPAPGAGTPESPRGALRAHVTMLGGTLLIASSFPVSGAIAGSLDSSVLTLLRFALASLVFLPLVALRHGRSALPSGTSLLRYGTLSAPLVGFFLLMFEALETTSTINTGAWFTFAPGFGALIAFALLRERLGTRRIATLLAGMVGALWVVLRGDPSRLFDLELVVGDGLFLAGTASLGLYSVLVNRLRREEPLAVLTFWTLVTGSGWLLLLGGGELSEIRWGAVEPRVFAAIAYLAIFPTLTSFLLSQRAIAVIGSTRTIAYTYLNPGLVAVLAWALGGAAIGWSSAPGIALTLVAMVVFQQGGAPASAPKAGDQRAAPARRTPPLLSAAARRAGRGPGSRGPRGRRRCGTAAPRSRGPAARG